MSAIISARGLGRWYGPVIGVNDLSVDVGGGITGLLGPNGAGKSTFLKLVTGQLRPSRGSLKVLGHDPFANPELFRMMGFCPEQDMLYEDFTAAEMVTFLMRLAEFSRPDAERRARASLDRVGLGAVMGRRIREFSKGMRQRVKLAQAIAHEPKLLILDEPLTGLDPLVRADVLELLRNLSGDGMHLVFSTHVLEEVDALTETILLIHRGRALAEGRISGIRELLNRYPRKVRILAARPRELSQDLLGILGVSGIKLLENPSGIEIETRDLPSLLRRLPECVRVLSPGVTALECTDMGLESVFDDLVGKR